MQQVYAATSASLYWPGADGQVKYCPHSGEDRCITVEELGALVRKDYELINCLAVECLAASKSLVHRPLDTGFAALHQMGKIEGRNFELDVLYANMHTPLSTKEFFSRVTDQQVGWATILSQTFPAFNRWFDVEPGIIMEKFLKQHETYANAYAKAKLELPDKQQSENESE
jgi:hypothetical protein